ncbi:MAG: hypothetical protein FWH35_03440, partial [Treponema sp.]|nr:hypothetical protein [Treponema sp.]
MELIRQGLAVEPYHDDSITLLLNRASTTFDELNSFLAELNEAAGPGSDETELGKIFRSVNTILSGAETLPSDIDKLIMGLEADLTAIMSNLNDITSEINDPDNLLYSLLDTEKDIYPSLVSSLKSLSGVLDNLDRTIAFIPSQLPQIAGLLMDLRVTIKTAEDVLIALTNNPLLRKGIPDKPDAQGSGTGPRDIRF